MLQVNATIRPVHGTELKFISKYTTEIITNETENIFEEYKKTGLQNNHELVPDSMINELCISGTPDECKKQLKQFRETGIDLPIIQFNPTDNVQESFDLFTSTFSEVYD